MQVDKVHHHNTNFESKGTFLNRAKSTTYKAQARYWESLHNEAKARLYYQNFKKTEREFSNTKETNPLYLCKLLVKMACKRLKSAALYDRACSKFPNRFAEPDKILANEERYYQLKNTLNF